VSVESGKRRQHQLTLEVQLRDDATLDNFLPLADDSVVIEALRQQILASGEPVIFLYGPKGSGKSHLLQASCHLAGAGALYLPLAELAHYSPDEVLQGVEAMDLVCLDDIEAVLGNPDWEAALFNFYNRAQQANCALQLAADAAPRSLSVELPDLRSRLSWGVVFQLGQGGDEEKAEILAFRARRRGLTLPADVATYIVNRSPRDMEALLAVLDTLDEVSLAEQRPLSIPFVKATLGW